MGNLASPTVAVNDDVIEIKPNSFSWKAGRGDYTVRTQQAGGVATVVANKNAETQMSMCKFVLLTTATSWDQLQTWLDARENGGVTIDAFDGSINLAFRNMILVSEPEISTGSEGEIELEFQGPPISN